MSIHTLPKDVPWSSDRDKPMFLTRCCAGDYVIIREVAGGCNARTRLADMGFLPGERLKVVNNRSAGPLLVIINNTRLILGRGLAHRIIVIVEK